MTRIKSDNSQRQMIGSLLHIHV